jgi:hypothetical protein
MYSLFHPKRQRVRVLTRRNATLPNQIFRNELGSVDTGAILDMKWFVMNENALDSIKLKPLQRCMQPWVADEGIVAIVTSTGETQLWKLNQAKDNLEPITKLSNGREGVLNLSVDWSSRVDKGAR